MAYEGLNEEDELQRQLQSQLEVPVVPQGGVSTQPAGGATPLGGSNTGVAGGVDRGGPKLTVEPPLPDAGVDPRAGYARQAAKNNYTDIEGAGSLKTGGYMGGLEGFNTGAWGTDERGANTHKNTFGKIASRYDPKQAGASKALMADPDFQAYFPDAKLVEHPNGDMIDFGDGRPVDVLRGATAGGQGEAWPWGVDDGSGGGGGMGGGGELDMGSLMKNITGGGDAMGGIQAELDKLINGQDEESQSLIQKILAGQVQG